MRHDVVRNLKESWRAVIFLMLLLTSSVVNVGCKFRGGESETLANLAPQQNPDWLVGTAWKFDRANDGCTYFYMFGEKNRTDAMVCEDDGEPQAVYTTYFTNSLGLRGGLVESQVMRIAESSCMNTSTVDRIGHTATVSREGQDLRIFSRRDPDAPSDLSRTNSLRFQQVSAEDVEVALANAGCYENGKFERHE